MPGEHAKSVYLHYIQRLYEQVNVKKFEEESLVDRTYLKIAIIYAHSCHFKPV